MKNLSNPDIKFTDPDQLQFCLPVSETVFWYCELNQSNPVFLVDSPEGRILTKYEGEPEQLLKDAETDPALKSFLLNKKLWFSGYINSDDFSDTEKREFLESYYMVWDDFSDEKDRNQMICEIYFEANTLDFEN